MQAQWRDATEDLLRGTAGGLVFGVPLLFTMEMWWIGETASPLQALAALGIAVVPVFLLVATGGFRQRSEDTWLDVLVDTVVALGLGISVASVVLLLLERYPAGVDLGVAVRMAVFEAAPFAVGAAVAREVFSRSWNGGQDGQERGARGGGADEQADPARGTVSDLGATAVGAIFIALSIAPTEEVPMLATSIEPTGVILLVVASLAVSYGIVFVAGFSDQQKRREQEGVLQRPLTETVAAYVVSLVVAVALLAFFDNLQPGDPLPQVVTRAVVLGFPAAIGGAAGRLVV